MDLDLLQPTETKDNITNEAAENKNKVSTEQYNILQYNSKIKILQNSVLGAKQYKTVQNNTKLHNTALQ